MRKAQGAFIQKSRVTALCGDAFWDAFVTHPDVEKTYLNWADAAKLRDGTAFETYSFAGIDWVNYRGSDNTLAVSVALVNGSSTGTATSVAGLSVGMEVSGPNIATNSTVASINTGAGTFVLSSGNYGGVTGTYVLNFGTGNQYEGGGSIAIPSNKAVFFPRNAPGVFIRALAPADSVEWVNTLGKPEYVQMIYDRDRNEWVKAEITVYPLHICTRPEVLFTGTMDAAAD